MRCFPICHIKQHLTDIIIHSPVSVFCGGTQLQDSKVEGTIWEALDKEMGGTVVEPGDDQKLLSDDVSSSSSRQQPERRRA